MKKKELLSIIKEHLTDEEWEDIKKGTPCVPVSDFNIGILKTVLSYKITKNTDIDDERINDLTSRLITYLKENWADEPGAHKYVIASSLFLTFILQRPMHPKNVVGYTERVAEGDVDYYCPSKETVDGSVCDYCVSKHINELFRLQREETERVRDKWDQLSVSIKERIFSSGFTNSGLIPVERIKFYDSVRKFCEKNSCGAYAKTWACPPATGTLEECRDRVLRYDTMQLFSKAYMLDNSMDMKAVAEAMKDFKLLTDRLDESLKDILTDRLILTNESCQRCKKCTYPSAPCRFPEKLHHSIEGYGLMIYEIASEAGIPYINGANTVTFFGAVIYNV